MALGDVLEIHHPDTEQALRIPLAKGDRGVADTIASMRSLVQDANERGNTRATAARIVAGTDSRPARLVALFKWMQRNVDFCKDPKGVERIKHPDLILQEIAASTTGGARACVDCDESAPLAAALLLGAGFTPVFITIAEPGGFAFSHVYAGVVTGSGKALAFDPQEMRRVGNEARHGRRKVWLINV